MKRYVFGWFGTLAMMAATLGAGEMGRTPQTRPAEGFVLSSVPAHDADFGDATRLSFNGFGPPAITPQGHLRLTGKNIYERTAVFHSTKVGVWDFRTRFRYQSSDSGKWTGFAFVLQNEDVKKYGEPGAGLGYKGIPNSLALCFSNPNGISSVGLAVNGVLPTTLEPTAPVLLDRGAPVDIEIAYSKGQFEVTLTDPQTRQQCLRKFKADLARQFPGGLAWAGFSAANDGGPSTSVQDIQRWSWSANAHPQAWCVPYRNDALGAFSMTFDDNVPDQITLGAPLLEARGFRGTFFLIANNPNLSQPGWKALLAKGHEIGNHSWSHKNQSTEVKDAAEREHEINDAYTRLTEVFGQAPVSFRFPYGASTPEARALVSQKHLFIAGFFMYWGNHTAAEYNQMIEDAIKKGDHFVGLIHGVKGSFSGDDVLPAHLDYIKQRSDSGVLWVDRFDTISKYRQQYAHTTVATQSSGPSQLTLTLKSDLDPKVFDQPMTVAVPVGGVTSATATTAAGRVLETRVRRHDLLVLVPPAAGPVRLQWTARTPAPATRPAAMRPAAARASR